jgi:hypothetical protein
MEPSVESCCDNLGHWGGSVILGQVIKKLGFCLFLSCCSSFAWTTKDVVYILSQCSAGKASTVNTVVLGCPLVQCWGPIVGELGYLELLTFSKAAKGGLHAFPIDVIERGHIPVCFEEGVMPFGFFDQLLVEPVSSSSSGDIIILFLGDQFTVM